MNDTTLLRLPAILAETGLSRSTIYNRQATGLFPRFIKIGPAMNALPFGEVRKMQQAAIAGKTDDEIRELVSQLHDARKAAA